MEEHQGFHSAHRQCMDQVETLRRRLAVCGDLAGDRQDVQDRMAKLQVGIKHTHLAVLGLVLFLLPLLFLIQQCTLV